MKLKIYSKENLLRMEVGPSDNSEQQCTLLGSSVNVSFKSSVYVQLDIRDYIDVFGRRYWLKKGYRPLMKSESEFEYNVIFYDQAAFTQDAVVLKLVDGEDTPVFSLDDTPAVHLQLIVDNINRIMGTGVYVVGEVISGDRKNIEYNKTYCLDALNNLAELCKTECWIEGFTVNLSRAEHGSPIRLGYGQGLINLKDKENETAKFYTRLIPLGSTRNIDQKKYGHSRLQLPGGLKWLEDNLEYGIKEHVEEEAFSGIYPRYLGTITAVRTEEVTIDNIRRTIYYVSDSGMNFNPADYEIAGLVKQLTFQSGELNGRDFETNWHPRTGEWEIINQYPYENQQLPGGAMIPKVGDKYIPWNFRMPDEYYPAAEQEFYDAAQDLLKKNSIDTSVYAGDSDYIYFEEEGIMPAIGRRVTLLSTLYFNGGERNSRIIAYRRKLNNPTQYYLEFSDATSRGRIDVLESDVKNIKAAIGATPDDTQLTVVRRWDNRDLTDYNVLSSLRTLTEIDKRALSRITDDTAAGIISFEKEIKSSVFLDGMDGRGWQINQNGDSWFDKTFIRDNIYSDAGANSFAHENGFKIWADGDAWLRNAYIKKDAMFQGSLSSPFFVSGFPAGIGWALTWRDVVNAAGTAAKKAHLEIDDITVRGILRVYEMVISQLLGENGTRLTTDMMKVKSVDTENKIIYLDTEEGALYNPFWTDDIIMVQRFNGMPTQENGHYVTRQYEFVVEETHIGGQQGEERVDWIKYKNFVGDEAQITDRDTLVRVDNLTNSDRKGVIKQTSVEPGSPYMDIMYGMKTDPDNAVRTRVGRLEGLITPYWGQLQGYGIMCDNAYLKGRFMLHNGDDVFQKFEIIDGKLESEISAIRAEISDKDNCLSNSSFASDLEKWEASSGVSFFTVNSKFLYFNSNFYSYKNRLGAITQDGGRKALRLKNNTIKQLNEFLKNKPEEQLELEDGTLVWPSFYVSFRYKVLKSGTLTVGFKDQNLYHTEELEENAVYEDKEYSGTWDGTGDFSLSFTGDIYIYSLSMTSDPLEDFKTQFLTRITQTEKEILLHAQSIQDVANRVTTTESNISVMAGNINIWASRVTEIEGRVSSAEHSIINVLPSQISAVSSRVTTAENGIQRLWAAGFITTPEGNSLFARRDNIISTINQSPESVTIDAGLINLTGKVSFSYLDRSLQDRILSKADSSSLGGLAFKDKVEQAMKDETLIVGGYIKTSLIKVDEVLANAATIGQFRIEDNTLTWRDWGDGALIKLGFSYSFYRNTCITVKADFMGIGITALNTNGGCAIFASMYSSPSYPGTTYLYAMFIDGDLVITRGNIIVRADGVSGKGGIQADRVLPQNGWSGSFKGKTVKVENGIITNVS